MSSFWGWSPSRSALALSSFCETTKPDIILQSYPPPPPTTLSSSFLASVENHLHFSSKVWVCRPVKVAFAKVWVVLWVCHSKQVSSFFSSEKVLYSCAKTCLRDTFNLSLNNIPRLQCCDKILSMTCLLVSKFYIKTNHLWVDAAPWIGWYPGRGTVYYTM